MVEGLERRQLDGDMHFVTFSCYHRLGYLDSAAARDLFEDALARMSYCYEFEVVGYVVMPEHVHLLVGEPGKGLLAVGLQALKLSVAKRAGQRPFWQSRYYDFNVFTAAKRFEKLHYMHANPVKRGLVSQPRRLALVQLSLLPDGVQGRVRIGP